LNIRHILHGGDRHAPLFSGERSLRLIELNPIVARIEIHERIVCVNHLNCCRRRPSKRFLRFRQLDLAGGHAKLNQGAANVLLDFGFLVRIFKLAQAHVRLGLPDVAADFAAGEDGDVNRSLRREIAM